MWFENQNFEFLSLLELIMLRKNWKIPLTLVLAKQAPLICTINLLPGYRGIMATRHVQFCCIFAVTKDKFDYFEKKFVSL